MASFADGGLAERALNRVFPGTKPEAGRERIITVLGPCPSHSTNWPGAAEAGRAVRVVLLELELVGRVEYLADRIALCASANET
jgi:hypothetical protein